MTTSPAKPAPNGALWRHLAVCGASCLLTIAGCAHTSSKPPVEARSFSSPDEAAQALVAALRIHDPEQVVAVLGGGGEEIIDSGDPAADTQRRQKFLAMYDQKHALVEEGPDTATLVIGDSQWPFPVPIASHSGSWAFDTSAGKEEILNRRIGENELSAIQVCRAIADAQREYALQDRDDDGIHEYAQKFASDSGQRNGLFWPTAQGEELSPLGELAASASAEGYQRNKRGATPYHGYYYRLLQKQGSRAAGGALEYRVGDDLTLGYAVLAIPAQYGNSGVMTFIMGSDGVVYQKDLGEDTLEVANRLDAFDPDETWTEVK